MISLSFSSTLRSLAALNLSTVSRSSSYRLPSTILFYNSSRNYSMLNPVRSERFLKIFVWVLINVSTLFVLKTTSLFLLALSKILLITWIYFDIPDALISLALISFTYLSSIFRIAFYPRAYRLALNSDIWPCPKALSMRHSIVSMKGLMSSMDLLISLIDLKSFGENWYKDSALLIETKIFSKGSMMVVNYYSFWNTSSGETVSQGIASTFCS